MSGAGRARKPQPPTASVSDRKRRMLHKRQRGLCHYCKRRVALRNYGYYGKPSAPDDPTLDHVVPRSKGGLDIMANMVLACYACNQAKDDSVGFSLPRKTP